MVDIIRSGTDLAVGSESYLFAGKLRMQNYLEIAEISSVSVKRVARAI
jgi:hypothetical protein